MKTYYKAQEAADFLQVPFQRFQYLVNLGVVPSYQTTRTKGSPRYYLIGDLLRIKRLFIISKDTSVNELCVFSSEMIRSKIDHIKDMPPFFDSNEPEPTFKHIYLYGIMVSIVIIVLLFVISLCTIRL